MIPVCAIDCLIGKTKRLCGKSGDDGVLAIGYNCLEMMKWLLMFSCFFVCVQCVFAQQISVIPYPERIVRQEGSLKLKKYEIVCKEKGLEGEKAFLCEKLQDCGVKAVKTGKGFPIVLALADGKPAEGYLLEITPQEVCITGSDRAGVFYGIQTFLQLVEQAAGGVLACMQISDSPRYEWRGFMLDEARHFFGKQKVMQLLDAMARYKLNKFHWHLTDEPGWRIEIKKYPRLATVGGQGNWSDPESRQVCYHTQQEIREIVAYAAARHIEVIPEIDMPGHATAANRAYPEHSGGGTAEHPDFTFNVGQEATYGFLTDILREVSELFPSDYLHIGGDEVAFGSKAWETDPAVQKLMQRKGMKNVKEVERYFMRRMADSVRSLGKVLVGWDELLDLEPEVQSTRIMWWRHDRPQALERSLQKGYVTVLCPRRPLYFDFIQHKEHKWGRVWDGFCPVEDVYRFPDSAAFWTRLPEQNKTFIRGLQANLWTERVQHEKRLDFMTFPRLCALAEAAWTTPENKCWTDFEQRLSREYRWLDGQAIYYFDPRDLLAHPEPAGCQQKKKKLPMDFRD